MKIYYGDAILRSFPFDCGIKMPRLHKGNHNRVRKLQKSLNLRTVRQSVEDTPNALLNAEADAICQASRYQHSPDRQDTRAELILRERGN